MNRPSCPACGSDRVHRGRRRSWLDRAISLVGARTCRCHGCNVRFAHWSGRLVPIGDVQHAARRLAIVLIMMTAAGVIIVGVLWFNHLLTTLNPAESRTLAPAAEIVETS